MHEKRLNVRRMVTKDELVMKTLEEYWQNYLNVSLANIDPQPK